MTPFETYIDAGTKACLAALRGDEEDWKHQVKRGREAFIQLRNEKILNQFGQFDVEIRTQHRPAKPSKPLTQNLGDLLRAANLVPAEEHNEKNSGS